MVCIFCKIASKEVNSDIVFENEEFIAFKDINPQAPVHILLIPKKHVESVNDLGKKDKYLMGRLINLVPEIAKSLGLENGYRIVNNCGIDAGQVVPHLHIHILGGRKMNWPPG